MKQRKEQQIDEKILDNIEELLNIYYWLYSAMCKYTLYTTEGKMLHTRRDDRRHTYMCMKNGINDSFLSTSLNLQSQEYSLLQAVQPNEHCFSVRLRPDGFHIVLYPCNQCNIPHPKNH